MRTPRVTQFDNDTLTRLRYRFWSATLVQRSALELSGNVYEVRGGAAAAHTAGARP